jgi:hypothetical protein
MARIPSCILIHYAHNKYLLISEGPKAQPNAASEAISPAQLDLRIGKIVSVKKVNVLLSYLLRG